MLIVKTVIVNRADLTYDITILLVKSYSAQPPETDYVNPEGEVIRS